MDVEGKYWILIEEAPFDPDGTPQIELKEGTAVWFGDDRPPGTYRFDGEKIEIVFETGPSGELAWTRERIEGAALGDDYFTADLVRQFEDAGGLGPTDVSEYCILLRVGGGSEAQVIDAESDRGCECGSAAAML